MIKFVSSKTKFYDFFFIKQGVQRLRKKTYFLKTKTKTYFGNLSQVRHKDKLFKFCETRLINLKFSDGDGPNLCRVKK